jgi:hypothetical protein
MSSSRPPNVSIIIVNYDEEEYLVPLLESIRKQEADLDYEIIIADNHSRTDISRLLGQRFPEAAIHKQPGNDGFARTCNRGMKMARGEFILLLNPDMLLTENCISRCLSGFERHAAGTVGAVSCRLNHPDGRLQKSFFSLSASLMKTIQANPVCLKLFGQNISKAHERRDNLRHDRPGEAPWLCGAFLLMKRETVMRHDLFFDEDFFLYSEDCEWGHRATSKGLKLLYDPHASIVHYGGGSAPFQKRFEQLTISEWLCMMKVHGKFYFLINQLLLLLNFLLDGVLFRLATVRGRIRFSDRRAMIIRRKHMRLWRQFTHLILTRYHRRPSSSKSMLNFSAR